MTTTAILFDLDGTLVDSNEQHVTVWQQVLAAEGHAFDHDALLTQIGKGADNFVTALLPDADAALVERLGDAHGEAFKRDHLAAIRPFPGAIELLRRAHDAGLRLAFASSASMAELEHYLEILQARALVEVTTSADDVAHTKPAPDIFMVALDRLGLAGEDAIVVGDTPYDIQAARGAGIATIALRSGGYPDEALRAERPAALYDDVAALLRDYDDSPLAAR